MILRLVNRVEQTVLNYRLSTLVTFESLVVGELKPADLIESIRLVKLKHPYLRMKIVRDKNPDSDRYWFIEQHDSEIDEVSLVCRDVKTRVEFDDWQTRLNQFGNKQIDLAQTVFHIELYRFESEYQFLFGLSHTGFLFYLFY